MAFARHALAGVAAAALLLSGCSEPQDSTTDPTTDLSTEGLQSARPTPTRVDNDRSTSTFGETDQQTATSDQDMQTATGIDTDLQTATQPVPPDTDTSTATASGTPTAAPTEAPADTKLPPFGQEAVESAGDGDGQLLATTVRLGLHEDYDRVVFDLEGKGSPGYRVDYVDQAVQDGSGQIIDVAGDAILQVVISGTRYPEENESYEGGPGTYTLDAAEGVEEVRMSGTFEGLTQAFIGIDDEGSPFRVFTLSDPPRLVVDIEHPAS